jgi:hypothetical protein
MNEYNFITNPLTGRKVNINGKIGQRVLANYKRFTQTGGHDGPCALNLKGNRCKKSDTWDNESCELSAKRNCIKKKYTKKNKAKLNIKLDDIEEEYFRNFIITHSPYNENGVVSEQYLEKAMKIIKKIRYDPGYISIFTGKPITIQIIAKRYFEIGWGKPKSIKELCNDEEIQILALKNQILDQMGEETFWSDIANQ